jgi:hypothetical protein
MVPSPVFGMGALVTVLFAEGEVGVFGIPGFGALVTVADIVLVEESASMPL